MTFTLRKMAPEIEAVLSRSTIDGINGVEWLNGDAHPERKACLLNILATLAVTPLITAPLLRYIKHIYAVSVERVYAVIERTTLRVLNSLADDLRMPFYEDVTRPLAVHTELLHSKPGLLAAPLQSFRSERRPSLQIVIASNDEIAVADIDQDLWNPLKDVVSFFGHIWEVLFSKQPTNHLKLYKQLAKSDVAPWLGYKVA